MPHIRGIDGLRAIAVAAVIAYHFNSSWLPGGYLGVDVFFVISGYLITSLLISEQERTETIRLGAFWLRRARRLLPALFALLLEVTVLSAIFAPDALWRLKWDLPSSVFYVMNWRLILHKDSYFAAVGRPPLLQHLWSLAVEEQFYLVWPVVLYLFRRHLTRARVAAGAGVAAAASALAMALVYSPNTDPSPVYFNTFTHAEGILLGCALAAALPPWMARSSLNLWSRDRLEIAGVVGLAGVLAGMIFLGFFEPTTYRGGMLLVDVGTAIVIATVAQPSVRLNRVLGSQPLRWAGQRSYSLYLWHWPILELTRPSLDLAWTGWTLQAFRLILIVAAAEASYRWVEQPWREGRRTFSMHRQWEPFRNHPKETGAVSAAIVIAVVAIVATAPAPRVPSVLARGSTSAARAHLLPPAAPTTTTPTTVAAPAQPTAATTTTTTTKVPIPASELGPGGVPAADEPILAIGDSVLLAASPALQAAFGPDITVDAAVSRQVTDGLARLAAYATSGQLAQYKTLVIALGTNGPFTSALMAQLYSLVAGVPTVVLVNVFADRAWTAESNSTMAAAVAAHPTQLRLANWAQAAASAPDDFYSDGIHPDPAGADIYERLVASTISAAAP